jgi:hypothetical protein
LDDIDKGSLDSNRINKEGSLGLDGIDKGSLNCDAIDYGPNDSDGTASTTASMT